MRVARPCCAVQNALKPGSLVSLNMGVGVSACTSDGGEPTTTGCDWLISPSSDERLRNCPIDVPSIWSVGADPNVDPPRRYAVILRCCSGSGLNVSSCVASRLVPLGPGSRG